MPVTVAYHPNGESSGPEKTPPNTLDKAGQTQLDNSESDEEDSSSGSNEEADVSLFDLKVPGVLTKEEVESNIDLDHWLLVANGMLVEMEVSMIPTVTPFLLRDSCYVHGG